MFFVTAALSEQLSDDDGTKLERLEWEMKPGEELEQNNYKML